MKLPITLSFTVICLFALGQVPSYVPSAGLVAWYPFNGNANDESINNNDGIVHGAVLTTDRFGATSSSYLFNGADWIDFIPNFDEAERSFSIWFNTSQSSMANVQYVLNNDYPSLIHGNSLISIAQNNGIDAGMGLVACTIGQSNINTWYHVVITRDASNTALYLNGVQMCQLSNGNSTSLLADYSYLKIGASRNLDGFFNGKIDDFGVWNRSLTPCEIQDLFSSEVNSVVNTVTISGALLTADQTGAYYQWLDCDNGNQEISMETNQSYTPTVSGSYAVQVRVNACALVSSCMIVDFSEIDELKKESIKLLKIIDLLGRETEPQKNTPLIYIYSDGTTQRIFEME